MKTYALIARGALLLALLGLSAPSARAGSIAGRVLDASGKPIAGAKVQWTAYRNEDELLLD
ncbi:MAG TPA: carboxypeptidase-like regulatory domain-containing protein, partial [Thermoanaerobaculia bacterium]|nr:carboxypeptidase-like regulatory domain-containing protein [Thermoanaerobaculia bacterium]